MFIARTTSVFIAAMAFVGCAPQPDAPQQSATIFVTSPPRDPCQELVREALSEYPDCAEMIRAASHGTCTADPAWEGARQITLRQGTASNYLTWELGYCAALNLQANSTRDR